MRRSDRTVARANPARNTRGERYILLMATAVAGFVGRSALGQELPVQGVTAAHDPSTITQDGSSYYYYVTGQGIVARSSTDLVNWSNGTAVFNTQPAWTSTAVQGFTGFFWAPDVMYRNSQYYMYYAVSTSGSQQSAIGLAISPTLNPSASNYGWVDQGPVIQSSPGAAYNTIDPSLLQNSDGTVWMSFGSYWQGIYLQQIDPSSGKVLAGTTPTHIAANNANNANSYYDGIEASYLLHQNGYYYLFENWGACCSGINSTYNLRVGRSSSITGPYVDENGVSLTSGGGSLFLGNVSNEIGPGQISFFMNGTQAEFGYHYYDANNNGAPTEGIRDLFWTASDWPTIAPVNPNWTGTGTSANWSTGTNWSGTVPNAAGNIANFVATASGTQTITLDGGAKTVAMVNFNSATTNFIIGSATGYGLILDSGNTNTVTINAQFGNHSILAPITANEGLGVDVAQAGNTLTLGAVSGSVLTKYGPGVLTLSGINTYSANVLVHQGTLDITGSVTSASFNSIGYVAGDIGILNVRGSGSFTTSGDLNIGDTGATGSAGTSAVGVLNLSGSAVVTVNSGAGFYVGAGFYSNTTATGTVYQTGGTLTANGSSDDQFTIGGRTSKLAVGVYNLSSGTVNANTNVWDGGYGNGTLNQTGGTFHAAANAAIGRQSGSTGIWNIIGGALNQTASGDYLTVGQSGTGTLNISGTAQVTLVSALRLGLTSSGSGTVNLNGGTLTAPQISRTSGSGVFNFSGGMLKAAAPGTTFMQDLTSANVLAGGATIDDGGFAITIAQPLLNGAGSGGLIKQGAGILTLAATDTFTGSTNISAGTLSLANGASLASTWVTIASGATLNVSGTLSNLTTLNSNGTSNFTANQAAGILARIVVAINIGAAGSILLSASYPHTNRTLLQTNSISFSSETGGMLDLANNDLIDQNDSLTTISNLIARGYYGGTWNGGGGIISSAAASDTSHLTALGAIENTADGSDSLYGSGSPLGLFDGTSPPASDTLVKFTYYGDANLDGKVDGSDYSLIDSGYVMYLTGWFNGDFNYDGIVNGSDYTLIDNAYNMQEAPLSASIADAAATPTDEIRSTSAVPEPATLGLFGIAIGGLVGRRRRTLAFC